MKCLKCRFQIPNDAQICAHCGHPTDEQQKHRGKLTLSFLFGGLPTAFLLGALGVEANSTGILVGGSIAFAAVVLVFKFFFKGEFNKTGFI